MISMNEFQIQQQSIGIISWIGPNHVQPLPIRLRVRRYEQQHHQHVEVAQKNRQRLTCSMKLQNRACRVAARRIHLLVMANP